MYKLHIEVRERERERETDRQRDEKNRKSQYLSDRRRFNRICPSTWRVENSLDNASVRSYGSLLLLQAITSVPIVYANVIRWRLSNFDVLLFLSYIFRVVLSLSRSLSLSVWLANARVLLIPVQLTIRMKKKIGRNRCALALILLVS
jgi:hypothetical protein